jgi:hypothetical protein
MSPVPDTFRRLNVDEVWTDGKEVIVLGTPPDNEPDDGGHDCDMMGCSTFWHTLVRARVESCGVHLPSIPFVATP